MSDQSVQQAAEAICNTSALLIGAGAGMGVDSGLPDFRGDDGFWKAYPPFRGRRFSEMSTPHWFGTDPQLAWGFFGHRLNLYRTATPHHGFQLLREWIDQYDLDVFVFTSNVDGQFQKAGFEADSILECHGSIHYLQCLMGCGRGIWPSADVELEIDMETIRARGDLPQCPDCGALARPNILMFNDWSWDSSRTTLQEDRFNSWRRRNSRIVAIEMGAGKAIPTVRLHCEGLGDTLIRINPREAEVPAGGISLPCGAREALERIDQAMKSIH